jgi:hypothetical protein
MHGYTLKNTIQLKVIARKGWRGKMAYLSKESQSKAGDVIHPLFYTGLSLTRLKKVNL